MRAEPHFEPPSTLRLALGFAGMVVFVGAGLLAVHGVIDGTTYVAAVVGACLLYVAAVAS